jgi:membrane protein YqaA with SNARE-associated domain
MLVALIQSATVKHIGGISAMLLPLGAFGLFFFGILDSLPLPIIAGSDILISILAGSHRNSWCEYAAVATAGSLIGAYVTFKLARRAGLAYLHGRLGSGRLPIILKLYARWETGALVVATAIPFFPASVFFAAAGASNYRIRKYFTVVVLCRVLRYSFLAILANLYGNEVIHVLRHPAQYWVWLLLVVAIVAGVAAIGVVVSKRIVPTPAN